MTGICFEVSLFNYAASCVCVRRQEAGINAGPSLPHKHTHTHASPLMEAGAALILLMSAMIR